ncbi:MAG TPA: hypothetical protein VGL95_03225 [Acetobacteraceae bacterium]
MAVFIFFGILGAIFLPALLATLIADLTLWKIIGLVAVAILIGGFVVVEDSDAFQTLYYRWTLPPLPPDETAFIAVADELRKLRAESAPRADRDAALHQTEAKLCALPAVVDNWVGKVEQMYRVSRGESASLTIGIWPHLIVRTAFFPDSTGTLIRTGSPDFALVSSLRQGDVVRFSGRIIGHAGACPGDPPIDQNEKLRDPEFLLRFENVTRQAGH